jgi:hypothetical protein
VLSDDLAIDTTDWLCQLSPWQRDIIVQLLATGDENAAAASWLASAGADHTVPFGGQSHKLTSSFYLNLLREMQRLLCTEDGYAEDREQIRRAAAFGQLTLVSLIATAVAPHLGVLGAAIGPAVALILTVLQRAGTKTACVALSEQISMRE